MSYDRKIFVRVLRELFAPKTFSLRRVVVVLGFMFAVSFVSAVRWCFQQLDRVLYPKLKDCRVEAPVFVVANPRSGTTFLHRLLSLDDERFTCMLTWQTIFPSVSAYALVRGIARVDRWLGRPLGRLVHVFERSMFKGWDGVHHVGFSAPEEEQLVFISTLIDPSAWMMLPSPQKFRDIDCLDDLDEKRRRKVMRLYRDALRAHVFAESRGRQILLSKNVFHAGRLRSIVETFPDARFVHLVRHPYSSLASSCSMFTAPWAIHSPHKRLDDGDGRYFAEIGIEYYDRMHRLEPELRERGMQFHTYRYDDLIDDPKRVVEDIYDRLGLEMSDAFRARLTAEANKSRRYKSEHEYSLEEFGITRDEVYEAIPHIFEAYGFDRHPESQTDDDGVDAGVRPEPQSAEDDERVGAAAAQPAPA